MDEHRFLKEFQKALVSEEFDCTLIKETPELPIERLIIFFGLDEKDRERNLEITTLKQVAMGGLAPNGEDPTFFRVQFQAAFPFKVKETAVGQVASLVCYLNRVVELNGFELDEVNLQISFRHVFLYAEKGFNEKLFLALTGIIMLLCEMFSDGLEQVASGEVTFNKILEKVIEASQKQPIIS